MKNLFKPIVIVAFSLITVLNVSGCSAGPLIISDEVRYSKINEVLEIIDYKNIGTIIEEEYDKNAGFSGSASWVKIRYENKNNTALEIYNKLRTNDNVICDNDIYTPTCRFGRVEIRLGNIHPDAQKEQSVAGIDLNDPSNGK